MIKWLKALEAFLSNAKAGEQNSRKRQKNTPQINFLSSREVMISNPHSTSCIVLFIK
jgi:hypothetical protein